MFSTKSIIFMLFSVIMFTKPAFSYLRSSLSIVRTVSKSIGTHRQLIRYCSIDTSSNTIEEPVTDLSKLEIRIGKIIEIGQHPEAENLYVEKVDVGESSGPRTIVSGLVKYCSIDSLINRTVVVLCNLKPRALKGITSQGMLLCASNEDHSQVVPLTVPSNAKLGDLVTFKGHKSQPLEAGNAASKAFSKIADDFFVDDNMIATFKGIPFMISDGAITSTLKGKIS